MQYEPVIGLEIHVQLNTDTKIFCGCSTKFGSEPNTQTCPVCTGMPGVLPVLNEEVLKKGILAGLALNCKISEYSKFDRKNYFYPDLPKAYQISQYDKPVCKNGYIDITVDGQVKRIGITRLHLEEDAGKSIHSEDSDSSVSYVDLNRTGIPLAEIVSEPDMRSGDEAYSYLTKIKSIIKYINVSDANMEEGSLRCDVNISVRETGETKFGEKVEVKNLNSFKAVKAAINYEFERQKSLIESGEKNLIIQETRLWDADRQETYSMRSKEDAHDYRYFPDPDLTPVIIAQDYIEEMKKQLPELPDARKERFIKEYGLSEYDSEVLTSVKQLADYYEETLSFNINPKKAANWITSELLGQIADPEKIYSSTVKPSDIAELLGLIDNNTISGKIAKTVFREMVETGGSAKKIIDEKGLVQVSDTSEIEGIIDKVIKTNPQSVNDYKNGKQKAMGFLIGQIMKESRGNANPQIVNELLLKKLSE
jgi:aspartyl-tRNA(Asn)/glutamyl-tRNA(Gln) amidotransferase subunit B